jgi:hypothetical protein
MPRIPDLFRRLVTPRGIAREAEDVALFALAAVMVPATWRLLLGWSSTDLIPGHDGIATVFLVIRELVEAHGRWSDLVYRADLFGGMKVRDAVGPLPALALLARLPLSPTAVFNLLTFLIQIVIAFLGVRTAQDLGAVLSEAPRRATWLERVGGVWMCAFAPVLAWRLGYGHHTLVVGGLPFLAVLALIAASGAGTVGATLLIVATAALVNGVLFTGHQMVLYGAVFGGPILLGLWLTCGARWRGLVAPALACVAALLMALPGLWAVFAHAFGSDSLRSLGRMDLTYSWLTSQPLDWLTSIPWTRAALPFRRPVLYHHEINYAAGPLLALLALVPWRRARALAVGLIASVAVVLLFSMDVRPFSTALLRAVPPLNSFRVPPRAILPAMAVLPVLVLAALVARPPARTRAGAAILALAAGAAFFLLPSPAREAVGWAAALGVVALGPQGRRDLSALAWGALIMTMAAGSLAAFRERLLPFVPGEAALARTDWVAKALAPGWPSLASPLVRATVGPEAEFEANTAFAARLSALDGYLFPSRRFVELVCALRGQAYNPNQLIVRLPQEHPTSRPMYQLYDVGLSVRIESADSQALSVRPLPTPAGPAWFSRQFTRTASFASLGQELMALGDGLGQRARETMWLVTADPAVAAVPLPERAKAACATARVLEVKARRGGRGATATVSLPTDCPLTFAMSYADTLRATAVGPGGRQPAAVFPAYGALAGVWVPKGTEEVQIEAVPPRAPLPAAWVLMGLAVLGATVRLTLPRRAPGPPPPAVPVDPPAETQ